MPLLVPGNTALQDLTPLSCPLGVGSLEPRNPKDGLTLLKCVFIEGNYVIASHPAQVTD